MKNSTASRRLIWAARQDVSGEAFNSVPPAVEEGSDELAFCNDCGSAMCKASFIPKRVFVNSSDSVNFGMALSFRDLDGVNRWSERFVCHQLSDARLETFHFELVRAYCDLPGISSDLRSCRDLQPLTQTRAPLYSWFWSTPRNLCDLVNCDEAGTGNLGELKSSTPPNLMNKKVILVSDHALDISWEIAGEVLQHSNTRHLIFQVQRLIEFLSDVVTLEPGDVISTGTPGGIGAARTPPRFLRPGDEMVVRVEGLGELRNPVVAEG